MYLSIKKETEVNSTIITLGLEYLMLLYECQMYEVLEKNMKTILI